MHLDLPFELTRQAAFLTRVVDTSAEQKRHNTPERDRWQVWSAEHAHHSGVIRCNS